MDKLRGQIGDLVIRRVGDQLVISSSAERRKRTPTPAQAQRHEQFRRASQYARAAAADPVKQTIYAGAARQKQTSIYACALGDFLNAPVVELDLSLYQGRRGDNIRIRAQDDYVVTGVEVTLTGPGGNVLEGGPARRKGGLHWWTYVATTHVPSGQSVSIAAAATDVPGHTTRQRLSWPP